MGSVELLLILIFLGVLILVAFLAKSVVDLPKQYFKLSVGFCFLVIMIRLLIPSEYYTKYMLFNPMNEPLYISILTYFTHGLYLSDYTDVIYICIISIFIGLILTKSFPFSKVLFLGIISYLLMPITYIIVLYFSSIINSKEFSNNSVIIGGIGAFFTGIFTISFWFFKNNQNLFSSKVIYPIWIVLVISIFGIIQKALSSVMGVTELLISIFFTSYYFVYLKENKKIDE